MSKTYKKKFYKIFVIVFISVILLFAANIFCSQKLLSVDRYEYQNAKVTRAIKVVQLSDLHNYQFGKDNRRLIAKIQRENPDVIFITGDMLNEDEARVDILEKLILKLRDTAPIYFSLGNHEKDFMKKSDDENRLEERLEAAGAVVLEKEYVDTEIAGQKVRIGGICGYALAREWEDGSEQRFMEEFQQTERFKILLDHVPEGLLLWRSMEHWDVDLVFSGHVHGGQVRLPFVGGLYDPEEGFFPTYTKGVFECGNGTMVLSSGLGSSRGVPRVNNIPEIVVCEITEE